MPGSGRRSRTTPTKHAEAAHPEHAVIAITAEIANTEVAAAWRSLAHIGQRHEQQLDWYGSFGRTDDPGTRLERLEHAVAASRAELATVQEQIRRLGADPTIRALPAGRLTREHDLWRCGYDTARESDHQEARLRGDDAPAHCSRHTAEHIAEHLGPDRDLGPGIGR